MVCDNTGSSTTRMRRSASRAGVCSGGQGGGHRPVDRSDGPEHHLQRRRPGRRHDGGFSDRSPVIGQGTGEEDMGALVLSGRSSAGISSREPSAVMSRGHRTVVDDVPDIGRGRDDLRPTRVCLRQVIGGQCCHRWWRPISSRAESQHRHVRRRSERLGVPDHVGEGVTPAPDGGRGPGHPDRCRRTRCRHPGRYAAPPSL